MVSPRRASLIAVAVVLAACGPAPPPPFQATATPSSPTLANGAFDLEVEGRVIHYEVHGQGPVVLHLTNSWGLGLVGLRELYRPLEAHLTMVYFDPRGLGGSSPVVDETDMGLAAAREDFHTVREHLGLDAVHAMGWSNGAMNLILLAADRPDTLRSATFVHGVASFTAEDGAAFAQSHPELVRRWQEMEERLADLAEPERTATMKAFWLDDYFPEMIAHRESHHAAVRAAFTPAQFSWAHADYSNRESPEFDARDRLAAVTVPSLVIAGAADLMPPTKVQALADGLPEARFELFEHSGHFAPIEEDERFREVVVGFITAHDGNGA